MENYRISVQNKKAKQCKGLTFHLSPLCSWVCVCSHRAVSCPMQWICTHGRRGSIMRRNQNLLEQFSEVFRSFQAAAGILHDRIKCRNRIALCCIVHALIKQGQIVNVYKGRANRPRRLSACKQGDVSDRCCCTTKTRHAEQGSRPRPCCIVVHIYSG